jgi:hypothetical protein
VFTSPNSSYLFLYAYSKMEPRISKEVVIVKKATFTSIPDETKAFISGITFPAPGKQGTIFGLTRILGKPNPEKIHLSEIINEHLERFHQTVDEHINIPRRFEHVLQAINEDIEKHISSSKKIPLSDFHAVIGVRYKKQIFVSGIGTLHALFLHKTAKQRYVIYELNKQFDHTESWEKPFTTVLDGELHPGDVFYVATHVSAREIGLGDLQDILVTLPPKGALQRIEQHLHRDTAYGAISFQVADKQKKGALKKVNPLTSIEDLSKTKEETTNLLGEQSPNLFKNAKTVFANFMQTLSSPGVSGPKATTKRILRIVIKGIATFLALAVKALHRFTALVGETIKRVRSKEKHKSQSSPKKAPIALKERIVQLPKRTKYISIGLTLIAILLITTVGTSKLKKENSQQDLVIDTIISKVEEKKDEAQANLIYEDTEQAKTLINEAFALLETVPQDFQDQEKVSSLESDLNAILLEIRGIQEVDIRVLADIAGPTDDYFVNGFEINGTIYAVKSNLEVIKYNELNQRLDTTILTIGSVDNPTLAVPSDSNIIIADVNQSLGLADLANNTLNPIVSGTNDFASLEAMQIYNSNLYAIAASDNQIIKMRPQNNGFDAGTPWITANSSDLSNMISLAIDGDIYTLTNNDILKFSSGKQQNFNIDTVDPILKNPLKIWTDIDSNYLYVLDPQEGRVIVFNKTGSFITQYISDQLKGAVDIAIREDKNTIVAITPYQLLSFDASHLLQ